MHPPAMMRAKLGIARDLGTQYIKQEYMLSTTISEHGESSTGSWEIETLAEISPGVPNDEYIQTLYDNGDTGTEFHNRNEIFDSIHNSNFIKGQNRLAVLPIKNSSYVASGVINYLDEWDNRNSEEALCFDIDWQDGILHPIYGGSWTEYQIWLNTPINHYANKLSTMVSPPDLEQYGLGDSGGQAKDGISMDEGNETPTSTVAITNYCTYRRDVYTSYTTQTLVACSDVITDNTLQEFTIGPEGSDPSAFTEAFQFYFGVTSAGRVGFAHCYGDVAYGSHRIRTTSQVGMDTTGAGNNEIDPPLITFSSNFATMRIAQYFPLMSPINPYFIDTLQSEMGDYTYVNRACDPVESNDYSFSTSFLKLNDFRQPGVFEKENMAAPALPYRVARSAAQTNDSKDVNLRRFPVLDTYEQTRSRGEIVNIQSFNDKLIIHHGLGLFVTRGQEKLATSTGEITFGDGDIFATKPIEVIPTTYGYGGTQHQLSCALTPNGYFFVDESQGKIFQYTDKLVDIGRAGLSNFLKNNLKVRKDAHSSEAIVGLYPGIQTSYDPWFERVIFHLRNWEGASLETNAVAYSSSDGEETGYYNDATKTIKDFYLSYTPSVSSWTSFHNYNTLSLISTRDTLYSINTNSEFIQIYQHNSFSEPVGSFAGERKMSYIDIAFPFGQGAILSDINWYTKVVDGNPEAVSHKEHDSTFTHAMVYNDYQCSGNISLIRTARGVNGGEDVSGNMRRTDYKWFFNQFRDLVNDRTLSFIDEEGAVIDANIDTEKPWNEQKRFVGNFANVRLTLANTEDTTNALYLYDVDAKVRKSYR
jgi:hypothetical protein